MITAAAAAVAAAEEEAGTVAVVAGVVLLASLAGGGGGTGTNARSFFLNDPSQDLVSEFADARGILVRRSLDTMPPMRPINSNSLRHSSSERRRRVAAFPCWWQ